MFCFQCEQTCLDSNCHSPAGNCGKSEEVSNLQDELTENLISLVLTSGKNEKNTETIIESLFMTVTNVNFDPAAVRKMIGKVKSYITGTPIPYSMQSLWCSNEDIRSLKSLILFGLRGIAAYAHHALILGYVDQEVDDFYYEALEAIAKNEDADELYHLVLKTGRVNLKVMELLDKANTETYGKPEPTQVATDIEPGPFIVVTGHDLRDLAILLEQTKDKGINVYTHGEMLPCHAYPGLKKYSHLRGNFGTAWQNQQKEFDNLPAPILFTTNCIMPVKNSYNDRVYTTSVVGYPGMVHIGEDKDFSPIIKKSLELKGYEKVRHFSGLNGGNSLTTGFGKDAILGVLDQIVEAVQRGDIKHFFLVGGCDGAKMGRNYYTEFVKKAPKDSIILTLACGKYRFNDLDLGTIGGLPRILDMGQCNDAYSAVQVVLELSKVFNCTVNDLPLTIVLSWYEQKAIAILLTLLSMGIKNIYIGPTVPVFISSNVLNILVENYNIRPISSPEKDLEEILNK